MCRVFKLLFLTAPYHKDAVFYLSSIPFHIIAAVLCTCCDAVLLMAWVFSLLCLLTEDLNTAAVLSNLLKHDHGAIVQIMLILLLILRLLKPLLLVLIVQFLQQQPSQRDGNSKHYSKAIQDLVLPEFSCSHHKTTLAVLFPG